MRLIAALFLAITLGTAVHASTAPLELEAWVKTPFTADLPQLTKLSGPFSLISGPSWLSINASGVLTGTPKLPDLGDNAFTVEAKTGGTWVTISVLVRVRETSYTLKIFSAPWCSTCRAKIPDLEAQLAQNFGTKPSSLNVELYVETSDDPAQAPDAAATAQWAADLDTKLTVKEDAWRWQEYRKFYTNGFRLPAAVLVDAKGALVKTFVPGTFTNSSIVSTIHAVLQNGASLPERDIVLVVDNSGSMGYYQATASAAIPALFDSLALHNVDWRLALLSTDIKDKPYLGLEGGILDAATPKYLELITGSILKLGTSGDGVEQTFAPVSTALQKYPGFHRPSAELTVVVVTDEDEQGTLSVPDYLKALSAHSTLNRPIRHFGVVGTNTNLCKGSALLAYVGSRVQQVIQQTGGQAYDLCSTDLKKVFRDLGEAIAQ
jgi:hypothetical protein